MLYGYGHFGMVEELSEDEIRAQMETNFFGALWVTQAALPVMREQRSGHIIQVTSEGGVRAFPQVGAYHASKWALEVLSESLAQEVEQVGIHVTSVEPGPYATDWGSVGLRRSAENPAYDVVRNGIDRGRDEITEEVDGDVMTEHLDPGNGATITIIWRRAAVPPSANDGPSA